MSRLAYLSHCVHHTFHLGRFGGPHFTLHVTGNIDDTRKATEREAPLRSRMSAALFATALCSAWHPAAYVSRPSTNIVLPRMALDEAAFEADRLAKDAEAMAAMKIESEAQFAKLRTPWKWVIRQRIWDYMEDTDIARQPRPVHHRIPNFDGAEKAAANLANLPEFQSANCVKVNPDTPQREVRALVLQRGKTLLTPQPRLRTGFFSTLRYDEVSGVQIHEMTNSKGVQKHGVPIGLDEKYTVDLVVVGSTGVCPTTGARVGKGEGFAELEWGILSTMGNLDPVSTLVVTTVHDCQVVEESALHTEAMPAGELTKHDVPVDIIVTPTRIIRVTDRAPKPNGVYWDLLSPQKLAQIKVLRTLKQRLEAEAGAPLPSGPDEVLPPTADRSRGRGRGRGRGGRGGRGGLGRGGGDTKSARGEAEGQGRGGRAKAHTT